MNRLNLRSPRYRPVAPIRYIRNGTDKESEQQRINQQRLAQRALRRRVDGLRYDEMSDEADGVQKRDEKDTVADGAVYKDCNSVLYLSEQLLCFSFSVRVPAA